MGEPQPHKDDEGNDVFVDELKPGAELMHGQYVIESFLNAGGFGITYRARDSLERQVVIKECFPGAFCRRSRYLVNARSRAHQNELESIVRLFVQEARSLAKLDHPNIVGVHNVFEENNTAYMALDFVEGRDLLDIIEDENTRLQPDQLTNILRELLGAIGFVHDQGILHRDISPDNILVNEELHPVLIDFGAAREQATKQSRVLSALRVVKDGYSPQEFYIQGSDQGPFSDLYALGASFYHVITGEAPANSQARLAAIASGQADPYEQLHGNIAGIDENVLKSIDMSLAVLPKDRLQSAGAWLAMMEGRAPTPANLGASLTSIENVATEKKSKAGLWMATTAIAALVVGGVVMTQTDIFSAAGSDRSGQSVDPSLSSAGPAEDEEIGPDSSALDVVGPAEDTVVADAADPVEAVSDPVEQASPEVVADVVPEVAPDVVRETDAADAAPIVAEAEPVAEDVETEVIAGTEPVANEAPLVFEEVFPEEIVTAEADISDLPPFDPALVDVVSTMAILVPEDEFIGPPQFEAVAGADQVIADTDVEPTDGLATEIAAAEPTAEVDELDPDSIGGSISGAVTVGGPALQSTEQFAEPEEEFEIASVLPEDLTSGLRPVVRPDLPPVISVPFVEAPFVDAPIIEVSAAPEPVATPTVPVDPSLEGNAIADPVGAYVLSAMAQIPPLPLDSSAPRGVPSLDLPVFPFAAEVTQTPEADEATTELVQTAAVAILPFDGLFSSNVNETRIYSVNGTDVDTMSEFNAVLRDTLAIDDLTEVTVTVGTGLVGSGEITDQELVLPIAQDTRLLNGMVFRTVLSGDEWVTTVIEAPDAVPGDIQVGDQLLAYVPTTELLRDRRSLSDLMAREISLGSNEFSFAVMRNNATWVASLTYSNPLLQPQD